ncbi:MAG: class I SAM-dependent methyltransferase [Chloroflexi bacterium]|nr:MAG: class I SAM-dependent methyltransferase [Chloroflexota bacterium]MBL1193080.1 class I SAM-dependent methyltransferase [Chloroflexota bacterium]NOH10373.1 class I SAM-dependent methyltransferase [Chloroflexota bacterium]
MSILHRLLAHPLTRNLDLDTPETSALRRRIIQEKPFLKRIYLDWYTILLEALPQNDHHSILELGSGGGFFDTLKPNIITSDLLPMPHLKAVLDGHKLPFAPASLDGIVMINVLHHLPDARSSFREASRCVRRDGIIAMVEPWITPWSYQIYNRLHHEPIDTQAETWEFDQHGPLSDANGALPWIIFQRDRSIFESEFPEWHIVEIQPFMPFRYLVSGGVSMRSLMPVMGYPVWKAVESLLTPWMDFWGMFAHIVLSRTQS